MTSPITNNNNHRSPVEDQISRDYKKIRGDLSHCILSGLEQFAKKSTENVPIGIARMKGNRLEFITLEYTKNEIEVLHLSICSTKSKKFTKKSRDEKNLEKIQQQLEKTQLKINAPVDKKTKVATLNEKANKLQSKLDNLKNKISAKGEKPLIEKKEEEVLAEILTRKHEIIEDKLSPYNSCLIIQKIIGYKVRIDYKNMDLPADMKNELEMLVAQNNLNNAISFQF